MAALAIAIYVLLLALTFGLRTLIHRARTGDSGWRGISGKTGSTERLGGILFVVAVAAGAFAPVAALLGLPEIGALTIPWLQWAGLVVALIGLTATLAAQAAMGASWRIGVDQDERTELRTAGLFAVVRNPIFTAIAITAAGLALMVPNALAITGLIALVIAIELQVRCAEEPYLSRVHGERYCSYAQKTGRFVPLLGRDHRHA